MRTKRRQKGMSQERLAGLARVTRVTLSNIENGDPKVQQRTLEAVLRAVGLDDLIERPAAELSDDELIAEMERRHPGSVRWTAHGDVAPPRPRRDPRVTLPGESDESAS